MTAKYFNVKNGLTTGNISLHSANGNITSNTYIGNVVVTNTANLGAVGNITITGGTSGYVLSTNGSGGLSWVAQSGGGGGSPGGSNTYVQFNDGSTFGGNAGLTFNKTTTTLTANNFIATTTANLGAVGNITITGGSANYVLSTNGSGNLSWVAQSSTGATVATIDNFTGNGVQTVFTLSTTPSSENDTIVNYNGAILQKNVYSLSGSDITFVAPPASGSSLEITTLGVISTSNLATTGKAIAMAIVFGF